MLRARLAIVVCPLLLVACGDADRNRCGSTSTAVASTETTALGFSAQDVFEGALGTRTCTWQWLDDEAFSQPMDAEISLEYGSDGVTFVAGEPLGRDAAYFECRSTIRAKMALDVHLQDGSLSRAFDLSFKIDDANATESVLDVSRENLQAYDSREHWYARMVVRRELVIRVDQGQLSGELVEVARKPVNGEEMNIVDFVAARFTCD